MAATRPQRGGRARPKLAACEEKGEQAKIAMEESSSSSSSVSDETRFAIIDAVYLRPSLWDPSQDQKAAGQTRKELFREITLQISQNTGCSLTCEEVEKNWKNLKDTFTKCRKKITYAPDGRPVTPKWKFYAAMTFLDEVNVNSQLLPMKRRADGSLVLKGHDDEDDEEIGAKDRVQLLKVQKAIRDVVHEAQMEGLLGNSHLRPV